MEPSLEWPFFARRQDFCWPAKDLKEGKVNRKYTSAFDVIFSEDLYFVTSDYGSMHPMSFLVPASLPDLIYEGDAVFFHAGKLKVGRHELNEADVIARIIPPAVFDREMILQNCMALHANLKLFGRSSIALSMILDCKTGENILSAAWKLLLEDNIDFTRLIAFVGMGEGLTPAFDDFLSGMIFTDRFLGFNRLHIVPSFFAAIRRQTTTQAAQQLESASSGALSLRFEGFVKRMAEANVRSHEIVRLLEYGHSSGTDILCGVWFYLSQKVRM